MAMFTLSDVDNVENEKLVEWAVYWRSNPANNGHSDSFMVSTNSETEFELKSKDEIQRFCWRAEKSF